MTEDPRDIILRVTSRIALALLLASLVIRPLTSGLTIGPELAFLFQFFPLFAVVLWVLALALRPEVCVVPTGVGWVAAVYIACAGVSVSRASCVFLSLTTAFDWGIDLIFFWLVVQVSVEPERRRLLDRAFLSTALVVGLYGLYQWRVGFPEMAAWVRRDPESVLRSLGLGMNEWPEFRSRLESNQVFSTFVYPNALAGYFLVVIPVVLAALFGGHAKGWAGAAARGGKAALLAVVLVCMAMTDAKAAWACIPVQAVLFVFFLGDTLSARVRWVVSGLVLGSMAAGLTLVAWVPRFQELGLSLWDSLDVRLGYWRTSWRILADGWNWLLGVGAGNFQESYPIYKTVGASEVQKAHNHFIQLWTEIGVLGMLAFGCLWLIVGAKSLRSRAESSETVSPSRWGVGVWTALLGGGFGFYVASVYATPFRNLPSSEYYHGIALVMFLAWAVLLLVLTRGDSPEDSPRDIHLRRAGYLTGLCGLLMHSVLDFDLGVPGNAQTLWLIGGMVMAMAVPQARISLRLGHWGRLGLAMTALAGMMVLTSLLFPRLANSEVSKEHGRILFTGALSPNATKRLEDMKRADELLKEAGYDNPYDPESFFERGSVCQHLWAVTGQTEYAVEAYRSLRRANAIAPLRAGYHWRLGQLLELIAVNAPSVLETVVRPDYAGRETSHPVPPLFLPAMVEYDRTAELYPTKPLHLLPRADLLWRLGEKDKARALYNDILNLDRKILSRWRALRLTPEQRKEAEERSRDL